jgi:hypothetical protein
MIRHVCLMPVALGTAAWGSVQPGVREQIQSARQQIMAGRPTDAPPVIPSAASPAMEIRLKGLCCEYEL